MKSEHNIQKTIVKSLRQAGYIVVNTDCMFALAFISVRMRIPFISYAKGQGYTKGTPDILACKNGKVLFIEVKKWKLGKKGQDIGKGKQSPEQIEVQKQLESNGFTYYLIDGTDKYNELIENLY